MYGEFRDNDPVGQVTLVKADGTEENRGYTIYGRSIPPCPARGGCPAEGPGGRRASGRPAGAAHQGQLFDYRAGRRRGGPRGPRPARPARKVTPWQLIIS